MMNRVLKIAVGLGLVTVPMAQSALAQVTNYTTQGNLEVSQKIGCVDFSGLNNTQSPADIYAGLPLCLRGKEYSRAAQMFALAGVYATFDKLRVADRTAHQAHTVLSMQALQGLSPDDRAAFSKAMNELLDKNSPQLPKTCSTIRSLGAPTYFPRYMIQHGMAAFGGPQPNGGIVADFEPKAAWEKALDVYLHCPGR